MKRTTVLAISIAATASVLCAGMPVCAEENVGELKKQVEALQKRIEDLESAKSPQKPDDPWRPFDRRFEPSWDPFAEMRRMQDVMDRLFQNSFNSRGLSKGGIFSNTMSFDNDFDINENKDGYEIRFDMKGLDQEKVDIDITEHSITVKGQHSREDTEENENSYFHSQQYGSFMRTIPVPDDADTSKVKTEKIGNDLVIRLPKKVT